MSEETLRPNIPLIRKYVEWVEAQEKLQHGRQWYQGNWFLDITKEIQEDGFEQWSCGTACCVAGKVVMDHGWLPYSESYVEKDGEKRIVWILAAELLGIDHDDADRLFDGDNDARRIREIAEEIVGERL